MKRIFTAIVATVCFVSCENFVELDAPKTQIVNSALFANDVGATSAMVGIYSQLIISTSFASGGPDGVTAIAGLSADELVNLLNDPTREAIHNNNLTPEITINSAWTVMYQTVYQANAILEGVKGSTGITKPVRDQLIGEALFIRAFSYFYLVNFYGDVPLLLTTDYRVNRLASRTSKDLVYAQIEKDLLEAKKLLLEDYSFSQNERTRANKFAASALLARMYLYQEKWTEASQQAASIIENENFTLPDLESVFLANSGEAIFQLMPVLQGFNTFDGAYLYQQDGLIQVKIDQSVIDNFEPGDARLTSWTGSFEMDGVIYNYVNKYKVHFRDEPLTEYQNVFRLAEQILIRAESRAHLGDLNGSIDDVNLIRVRAGLEPLDASGMSEQQVLDAVAHERRSELFVEWGHRWFDLQRTGEIDSVLGPIKPDWQSTDALFPIAQSEIIANPNLKNP